MSRARIFQLVIVAALLAGAALWGVSRTGEDPQDASEGPAVLSVELAATTRLAWPVRVPVSGSITPWQEASVGAEGDAMRLTAVEVNVGDVVRRGQVLATFDTQVVDADLAEARAAVAQAEAEADEAEADAERAQILDQSGAMSAQLVNQYVVAARTARARLEAARAAAARQRVRLAQTRVVAPDDGIITARTATVGAVVPAGQEIFRLIRDGRLEWRGTVGAADLEGLAPGQVAHINMPDGRTVQGRVRMLGPAIDPQTLTGMLYVDVPSESGLRAGAFERGYVERGELPALTVPSTSVLLRDGFHYVMQVGEDSRVAMRRVEVGRRSGDRIEILSGLANADRVVASGVGFLGDGDVVRVVDAKERASAPADTAAPAGAGA